MTIGEFCKELEVHGATAISVGEKNGKGFICFQYEGDLKLIKDAAKMLQGILGKNVVWISKGDDQYSMSWR